MRAKKSGLFISLITALLWLWSWGQASQPMQATSPLWKGSSFVEVKAGDNLLRNGSMDEEPFYWRPTNHYIAGGWYEWWVGDPLPEFIDGGIIYHNVCYPPPPPGKICVDDMHNSSQGYIRWGTPYIAGIYQPVSGVTPCLPYTLRVYNRNDSSRYRPRVGIEPSGWVITRTLSGTNNCPPDGASPCPDPRFESEDEMPDTIVWSDYGDHAAYTWAPIEVTAEAFSTTISVWLYAAPLDSGPLSTYWDAASLTQGTYPGDRLPEPEDWTPSPVITNIQVITVLDHLLISWTTLEPTLGQVWYTVLPEPAAPYTGTLTSTVYLPLVLTNKSPYAATTPLVYQYQTDFSAIIGDLQDGETVRFVIVGRRLVGDRCTTLVSEVYEIPIHVPPLNYIYLPLAMREAQ